MASDTLVDDAISVKYRRRTGTPKSPQWGQWAPVESVITLREYDRFAVAWEGPSDSRLIIEGQDPISPWETFIWDEFGSPLWFPGEYRIVVEREENVLWSGRLVIEPQNKSTALHAPKMMELLESWVPGITYDPDNGILFRSSLRNDVLRAHFKNIKGFLHEVKTIIMAPALEFQFVHGVVSAHVNTRDNRAVLRALQWVEQITAAQWRMLGLLTPGNDAYRHRATWAHLHRQASALLAVPMWDQVDKPSSSDRLTQRGWRRSKYRNAMQRFHAIRSAFAIPDKPISGGDLTRVRPTPEIFEIWVLYYIRTALLADGWSLVEEPEWVHFGRRRFYFEGVPLKESRFVLDRGPWTLFIDYDRPLPSQGDHAEQTDGLWMSGPHNRPDFILEYRHTTGDVKHLIIEAKYRPRRNIWPDDPTQSSQAKGQLQQYQSSMMRNYRHVDPPILCLLPENDQPTWRPTKFNDIEFLVMAPDDTQPKGLQHLSLRLRQPIDEIRS